MVSRVSCYMELLLNIHRHAGLKFHREFPLVDGDFFNQPPDKRLVVFRQGGGLFSQEGTHIGDALFLLVSPGAFQLKLLLILAQAVNLLGDIFVVCSGAGSL